MMKKFLTAAIPIIIKAKRQMIITRSFNDFDVKWYIVGTILEKMRINETACYPLIIFSSELNFFHWPERQMSEREREAGIDWLDSCFIFWSANSCEWKMLFEEKFKINKSWNVIKLASSWVMRKETLCSLISCHVIRKTWKTFKNKGRRT